MEQYIIKGGNPLVGEVEIGGAKNAALGILAAAIKSEQCQRIIEIVKRESAGKGKNEMLISENNGTN